MKLNFLNFSNLAGLFRSMTSRAVRQKWEGGGSGRTKNNVAMQNRSAGRPAYGKKGVQWRRRHLRATKYSRDLHHGI